MVGSTDVGMVAPLLIGVVAVICGLLEVFVAVGFEVGMNGLVEVMFAKVRNCSGLIAPENKSMLV